MRKSLIIFDFDGTLAHLPTDYETMRKRLQALFLARGINTPLKPLLPCLKDCLRQVPDCRKEAFDIIRDEELNAVPHAVPIDQWVQTIEWLRKLDYAVCIVSNNTEAAIRETFLWFNWKQPDLIIGSDTEGLHDRWKPSSYGLRMCLDVYNAKAEDVIFVGDTEADEVAGQEIGMTTYIRKW